MKYSRSAITQLTRWYKQILIKCAILNAAILVGSFGAPAVADASEINQTGVPYATATSIQHSGNVFNISTTTTNGAGDVGLNTFGKFNVSEGDVANLNLINQQDKLVNLVFDSSASQIDGIVNSYKGGQIGGNILFANPNGFVVGKTGVFNVGSLTLMTPTEDTMKKVFTSKSVNDDMLNSLVSFKFGGDDYVLYDEDSDVALYPGSIKVEGTINSGAGIDLVSGGNEIEVGATGALNANMNFSGTGANVTANPKTNVQPQNTYKFAMEGGNGIVITSSNSGEDRDYLSAIVNLNGKVKANGGDVHVQTEIYQTDATEDKAVSKVNVKSGAEIEGHDVTMRAYSHIDGADKNILGMSGKSSDWQNILNGTDILNFLIEDFVHLGDIKTQVTVEDGAKIKAANDLTLKAEAILPIAANSIFETFAFNYTDIDILTEAIIKSGADIKVGNDLKVQALTDLVMTNNTKASSLAEIVADTFCPFGNYGAYALNISLVDMINRAVIEQGVHLDVQNNLSVLASMLRNYIGITKNGLIPIIDRNRGSAGIGVSIIDFSAKNEAIMNADAAIDGSLVVNADYTGSIVNTVSAWSSANGEDGNFGLMGRLAQGILGHGKLTKVFDFLETSKKSRAEATFNKIQIAGAINVEIDEAESNAYIGDAANGIKPTIKANDTVVGATLLDNKSQAYAIAEADNGETATSGAVVISLRNLDSDADVYGDLTLTGSKLNNALIIRSKTDIQHIEGLLDWLKQSGAGFGWWAPTEKNPEIKKVDSSNVDDYLALYGMSDEYQMEVDTIGSKFAVFNMVNFNDIGLNGLFGTFASSQANAASQGKATNAWAGAVSVAVTNAVSNALLHDGSTVNIVKDANNAKQNILILADSVSEVWSGAVLMSLFNAKAAFAGLSARDGDSAGGSLSIAVTDIDTTAKIGENVKITGQNSEVSVEAKEDGEFINIGNGSASADNAGLGGEFVVSDVAGGTTSASIEKSAEIKQVKDVKVNADRDDVYVNAAVAYTNSQKSKSFGISPLIVSNTVQAYIAGNIFANGKVETDAIYDKIIVNTAANLGVANAGTDNPIFTDMAPADDDSGLDNLDVLFENLSVIKSPVDPTKYVKTDFTRPLNADKETSAYAGNIVTNIFDSDIKAYIADGAKIVADSLKVDASSTDTIIDVGAVVAANGKSGGGATILFDMSKNQIDSCIGKAIVDVTNDLTVSASEEYMMIDVQAGIAQGKDKSGVGNLSVNLQLNEINAGIKDGAKINTEQDVAGQSVNVSANLENKTLKVVGGLSIQAGGDGGNGGAVGATLDANVYVNDVNAYIENADVNAGKNLDVTAESASKTIGIDVAGAGSTSGSAYAGTLGTYISNNDIDAHIEGARINQTEGRINKAAATKVKASSEYNEVAVVGTGSGGKSTAVGGSVSARIIADTIDSYVKGTTLDTASSLTLENKAQLKSVAITVAGSGSSSGSAVDGAIMVVVDATTQHNYIENSTINANALTMDSDNIYNAIGVTGAVAISGGAAAIGGSIYVSVTDNDMDTYVKNSDITVQNDVNMTSDVDTDSLSIIFAAGGGKGVAASGAVSTVVNSPDIQNYIKSDNGDKKVVSQSGKVNVKSKNKTDIDTINAAVSVGTGAAQIGGSVNTVVDNSDVEAGIEGMTVNAQGDVDVKSESEEKIMSISVGGAGGSGVTIAGSVNTMVMAADTDAYIKNSIIGANSVNVISSGIAEITGGTGSVGISTGSAALGASVVTGVIDNEVTAVIENSKVDADEDVVVSAEADETIGKSDAPFITVAGGFSQGLTLEGVVDTMIMSSTADAHIKGKKSINDVAYGVTAGKDVSIKAQGSDTIFAISGAVSASTSAGIGATINTVVVDKDVKAYAENAKITAAHDIKAEAKETDDFFTTVVAAAGAGSVGGSGVVNTNVITSDLVSGFKNSELKAGNDISSDAQATADMQTITGAVGAGGSVGIGLSIVNDVIKYKAEAYADGVQAEFKELDVTASADSNYQFTSVSGGAAGSAGIAGVENVNYVNNTVKAYADGSLTGKDGASADKININASDKVTFNYPIAGQVAAGGAAGVGGTVMVNSVTSTVQAYLGGTNVKAKDIDVAATGTQKFDKVIAMGFSGAGGVAFSGTVLVNDIDTTVQSYIKANSNIEADDIDVTADNAVKLTMYTGAGAIGGGGGFGASVAVNDFAATTEAYTGDSVTVNAKNITVSAENETKIGDGNREKMVVASGSGGLYAGIAGSVLWNIIENKTAAYIGNNNTITLADAGKLDLSAKDVSNISESVGSASLSGGLALGASVGGNEIHNTVLAYIGTGTQVDGANADVSILADSEENVDAFGLVASGGYVALSGGAIYTSIGKKVDNAAYNELGSEEKKTFSGAKAQTDQMTGKANDKNAAANNKYKEQYGDAIGKVGSQSEKTRISEMSADNDLFEKTAQSSVSATDRNGTTSAFIDTGSALNVKGVKVKAQNKNDIDLETDGAALGWGAVGVSVAIAKDETTTNAFVSNDVQITAESAEIAATSTDKHNVETLAATGGVIGGSGSYAGVNSNKTTNSYVLQNTTIAAENNLNITTGSSSDITAYAKSGALGGVAVGLSIADATTTGSTKVNIGDNVTLVSQAGNVSLKSDTSDKAVGKAWAATGGLGSGSGADVTAKTGKNNTISVGKNLTVNAANEFNLNSTATNNSYTEANGRAYGGVSAGGAVGRSKVDHTAGVNIADADVAKNITAGAMNISSKVTNEGKTDVYAGAGAAVGISGSEADIDIQSVNNNYVGKNYSIELTKGGYLLSANTKNNYKGYVKSDSYGVVTGAIPYLRNTVNSTVKSDSEADIDAAGSLVVAAQNEIRKDSVSGYDLYGGAGGLASGSGGSIKDNLTMTTNAKLGGNKAYAKGQYGSGDITVGAYNIAGINEKADLYAHGGIAGADTDSMVYLTANAKTEIANKDIKNDDDDINYVARNDVDIYTKANVESYGGVTGSGGSSRAQSSQQHADVVISGGVNSMSGRNTNISALSNKSLEAYIYERTRGAFSVVSGHSYAYNNDSEASITINSGAEVKSYDSMNLTARSSAQKIRATRDAIAYQLWGIPYKGKGNTDTSNSNSSSITINGAVESGIGANRKLTINNDGSYTSDGIKVIGSEKIGEITSADIDTDIQIYQNSLNNAQREYEYFLSDQNKLINDYRKIIKDNTDQKQSLEDENAGYQNSITIWKAINDIDSADFATKYENETIDAIQNLVTALNGDDADAIEAAKTALRAQKPSLTEAELNEKIKENKNSIDTCENAINLNEANIETATAQTAHVTEKYNAEVALLQGYIRELEEQKEAGETRDVYSMRIADVVVRSGETNVNTGTLYGSGSITAPGNTFTITVDNNSVNSVQYGDLIIGRNLKGGININASDASSVARTIINPGYNSKITITNNVDANDPTINFEGQSGDIWLKGNVENVKGVVDITNFTGSILSEGSITAKDLYMKAPNGELSQMNDPKERSTGSMIAGGDISYAAKTININGLIQSGSEIKNITIPEFSVIKKDDGNYYQIVNGVESEMKPSEMTEGYYYLTLLDYTDTLNSIQKIKTYFKPVVDQDGNVAVDADGHIQGDIYLFKANIGGGNITLTGNIVSDSNNGKIVLVNGYGHIDVVNNSNYDLVTSALNADAKVNGTLTINDFKFASGADTTYDTITQLNLTPEYLAAHAGTYTAYIDEKGDIVQSAENITADNGYWGETSSTIREDGAHVYATTYNPGNDAYMIAENGKTVSYQVYIKRSWIVELFCGKKYETRYYYQEPKYSVKNNAITVNFQGFDKPEINVVSKGNVVMNSNISALTGDVNIKSENGNILTKSSNYVISAKNITLNAKNNIGEEVVENRVYRPVQTAIYDNGKLIATAGKDIYINFPYTEISNVNLNAGNGNGNVYLATVAGDFNGTEKQVSIKADALDLRADFIGLDMTTNDEINIDIKKLKARAKDDITITNQGDVVVSSIVSENGGTVSIESQGGSIIAATDTGTYSNYHVHGGSIVLKALNGAITGENGESSLSFANDGIFHVEAKDNISLSSAGNIYVDLIKSTQGDVTLESQLGIIASAITDEDRYYNIAGKDINFEAWGGSIENISLDADGTVNASTYFSGLGDVNIAMVSQKPLTEDSTQEEIDAFNAQAKDLTIGIIRAGNNVTLSSEKGIKQNYDYSESSVFGISGERITLNATGDIGSLDAPVNTKVNRTISAFSSEGSNVYLSANDADYGMKIDTIDTHNGNGALKKISLVSKGHILDNSEKDENMIINLRADNISLSADKNIGSEAKYMVVETTSGDLSEGLDYSGNEVYIKGVGDLLNVVEGNSTGSTIIYSEDTDISVNNITADNDEHTAKVAVLSLADVNLSNVKAENIIVEGRNAVISDNITTDFLHMEMAENATLTGADVNYLTDGKNEEELVVINSDADVIVKDTVIGGNADITSAENTNIDTLTVDGKLTNSSANTTVSGKLDVAGDVAIEADKDVAIADMTAENLTIEAENTDIQSAKVEADAKIATSGDTTIADATIGGNFENTAANTTVSGKLNVAGEANIDVNENIEINDADIGQDLNVDAEHVEIAEMKLGGNLNAVADYLLVETSNNLNIGSVSGNTADYTNVVDIDSAKDINNGLGADDTNLKVKYANLTAGGSVGNDKALNMELAEDNRLNIKAESVSNIYTTGAPVNYGRVTAEDAIITSTDDVMIEDLNTDKLTLETASHNVNITGDVRTKGTIKTADKNIVIDNTSLAAYPSATLQLYLKQKPMHLIVDASNNIQTESQNVTRHNKNILVNKENYATSMEGEITTASEAIFRNAYRYNETADNANDSLYQRPTISDYISSIIGSEDYRYVSGYHGMILDDTNIMRIINQTKTDKLKGKKYSEDEKKEKLL